MIKSMFLGQKANTVKCLWLPSVLNEHCHSVRSLTGPEHSGACLSGKGCGGHCLGDPLILSRCYSAFQLFNCCLPPPPPCFVGSCVLGIYWDLILSAGSQHFPWKIFTRNGWGAHFPNTDRGRHVEGSFGCKQQAWALQELYDFVGITSVVVCCSEISSC